MGLFGSAAGKGRQPSDQSCHINWEAWMFIAAIVAFKPCKSNPHRACLTKVHWSTKHLSRLGACDSAGIAGQRHISA